MLVVVDTLLSTSTLGWFTCSEECWKGIKQYPKWRKPRPPPVGTPFSHCTVSIRVLGLY